MGKTQSTGNLTNALAQDSSNNIGIGGAVNASFKLQVTGATNLTSDLTVNGLTVGKGAGSIVSNTVVGLSALPVNTTGTLNTAIGNLALLTNTTGYGNTSVGYSAIGYNTTGFFNAAVGVNALLFNSTGTYNNALGTAALYANTTGSYNTAVGQQAGTANTTGSNNTYIGYSSGFNITTCSNNTIIGSYFGTAAMANNIVLADGAGNVRYQWDGTNNVFGNPLSGTSAVFSSTVQASAYRLTGMTAGSGALYWSSDRVTLANYNASGTVVIETGGGTAALTLASNQAATFSSNVTATQLSVNTTNTTGKINIQGPNDSGLLYLFNSSANARFMFNNYFGFGIDAMIIQEFNSSNVLQRNLMTFASGGNIGIGTSSPAMKLQVGDGTGTGNQFLRMFSSACDMYIGQHNSIFGLGTIQAIVTDSTYNNALGIGTLSGSAPLVFATNNIERMRITSGGNVGIGTTTFSFVAAGRRNLAINGDTDALLEFQNAGSISSYLYSNSTNLEINAVGSRFMQFVTNSAERMRITSGDDVYVTRNADASRFGILNTKSGGNNWYLNSYSNGSLYMQINTSNLGVFDGTTGVYTPLSDINKKKDFEQSTIGLNAILGLKPTLYRMKSDDTEGNKELGFIAQEVKDLIPQAYVESGEDENKFIGLNYNAIVAALVKSVQELKAEIDELKNK